jgi:transposase
MLEIDAEAGEEQLAERVAAIDVAKASAVVCVRVGHASIAGRRVTRVWEVRSTTNAIIALAEQLALERIERVVVESTSDYWRPFVYLLEARGLTVWLVNASQVKQVPGRPKTDKLDAVWLAKLNERGMLRPSFVPPAEIRRLRDYTRLRVDLIADRTRQVQRLEKLLEDALIKLSTVASDILGVSGRAMLDALIAGERDPRALAELARGRMRGKRAALVEALTGRFDDHHAELAQMLLDEIDALTLKAETLTLRIDQLIAEIPAAHAPAADPGDHPRDPSSRPLPVVARLDEITGIGANAAHVIVAEVGLDMTQSPTPVSSPGQSSAPAPSSRGPRAAPARPARATPTSGASSARPPSPHQKPTPSSANATAASFAAAANSKPSSPSPARSSSSSGTSSPTPAPATETSAPTSTPTTSTDNAKPVSSSANSKRSATASPSTQPSPPNPLIFRSAGRLPWAATRCGRSPPCEGGGRSLLGSSSLITS